MIAKGETATAIEFLLKLSNEDKSINREIHQLSARFNTYKKEKNRGTASKEQLDIDLNRINAAILDLIEQIKDDQNSDSSPLPSQPQTPIRLSKSKLTWWYDWRYWLGFVSSIVLFGGALAELTGYSVRDILFSKSEISTTDSIKNPIRAETQKATKPDEGKPVLPSNFSSKETAEILYSVDGNKFDFYYFGVDSIPLKFKSGKDVIHNQTLKNCKKCPVTLRVPLETEYDNMVTVKVGENKWFTMSDIDSKTKTLRGRLWDFRDDRQYSIVEVNRLLFFTEKLSHQLPNTWCKDDKPTKDCGLFYSHKASLNACPNKWRLPTSKDFKALLEVFPQLNGKELYEKLTTMATGQFYFDKNANYRKPTGGHDRDYKKSYYWMNDNDGEKKAIAIDNENKSITIEKITEEIAAPCICVRDF